MSIQDNIQNSNFPLKNYFYPQINVFHLKYSEEYAINY